MTTILERFKSLILGLCLLTYNGVVFLVLNALLWCEGMWSERRWSKPLHHRSVQQMLYPKSTFDRLRTSPLS